MANIKYNKVWYVDNLLYFIATYCIIPRHYPDSKRLLFNHYSLPQQIGQIDLNWWHVTRVSMASWLTYHSWQSHGLDWMVQQITRQCTPQVWIGLCAYFFSDNGRKPTFWPILSRFSVTIGPKLGQCGPKTNLSEHSPNHCTPQIKIRLL